MFKTAFSDRSHKFLLEQEISEILNIHSSISGNFIGSSRLSESVWIGTDVSFDQRKVIEVFQVVDDIFLFTHFCFGFFE